MNSKQYKNIIEWTLNNSKMDSTNNHLDIIKNIFKNMGISIPHGDYSEIYRIIGSNDYMGWRLCTYNEAQNFANNGIPVIGINENSMVVISPNEEKLLTNWKCDDIITNDMNSLNGKNLSYYSYQAMSTKPSDNFRNAHFCESTLIVSVGWTGYNPIICPNMPTSIKWKSSDSDVAEVNNSTGWIKAKKNGSAIIIATSGSTSISFLIRVRKIKIYQTEHEEIYDKYGNTPEDFKYNDIEEETLKNLSWIKLKNLDFNDTVALENKWSSMCVSMFSTPPLEDVILDMIDHFMNGSGSDYSNSVLTQKVSEHNATTVYEQSVLRCISELMKSCNGDMSQLTYYPNNRDDCLLVKKMQEAGIPGPQYSTNADAITGLKICINDVWSNKIEVEEFEKNGNTYSGKLLFTLTDHFGLDYADVEKYGLLDGFAAWYILQHNKKYNGAYKPFKTVIKLEVPFSGAIN